MIIYIIKGLSSSLKTLTETAQTKTKQKLFLELENCNVLSRQKKCFCQVCVDNTADGIQCENSGLVDQWTSQELQHTAVGNDVRRTRGRGRNARTRVARTRRGDIDVRNRGESTQEVITSDPAFLFT